jgi:tripartite ATP-independent transporter DctM subunit
MDPLYISLITIVLLLVMILLGMHVGLALASLSLIGVWWIKGNFMIAITLLATTSYQGLMEYVYAVIPMFVLMGTLANRSGASEELYDTAHALLARVSGGLAMATVAANAVFAAITGVSVASAAVFSKIAIPQMTRFGYDRKLSLGTVAASSLLGMLIPPSLLFIVYGVLSEESIGKLFVAGIIPGVLLAVFLCAGIYVMVKIRPQLAGGAIGTSQKLPEMNLRLILKPWVFILLILIILGGIYAGFFTPTEAGAIGAFATFVLCLLRGKITAVSLWSVLLETGYTTASVFLLLIAAQMYSRMLTYSGLPGQITDFVTSLAISPHMVVVLFLLVFLALGAVLDSISIMLVTMPIMLPVIQALGFDLIWFGIVAVVAMEIGFITPPFGLVVFAMKASLGEEATIEEIFWGAAPFLLIIFCLLALLFFFPILSTYLPSLM